MKKITLLTDYVPNKKIYFKRYLIKIKYIFKYILKANKVQYYKINYGGHFAVTRSIVTGFTKLKIKFNYNPKYVSNIHENVIVLSGINALKQCINLKKRGIIKKLYAGPNLVILSTDYNSIISDSQIDKVITPSKWVSDLYIEDEPSLLNKCIEWSAGIDVDYWSPNLDEKMQIVIYDKRSILSEIDINEYTNFIKELGYKIKVLKYGKYTHEEYFVELNKSLLMVCFSNGSESQGIAWDEAWSMNVPTLILKSNSNNYKDRFYKCSSAPYLNIETGCFFENLDEFKKIFANWNDKNIFFSPRNWSILNHTDEIRAKFLFDKLFIL